MKRPIIGNQAVAYGTLAAGIDVAAGYPGTPSSEALNELLRFSQKNNPTPYVEWSVNEKVAFELATGAAWAGKRALATMKMSGANVAADSILSVAYSGTKGGLVIYIADDPGAEAGMPEQDTRLFAQWAGLPVLEPADPARTYELTRYAFELSEACELPVILRSVTSVAHAKQEVEGEYTYKALKRKADFEKNIFRFTKAGAVICMDQHRDLLERLKVAERSAGEAGINRFREADGGELFVVAAGALIPYVRESLSGGDHRGLSTLFLESVFPLDTELAARMFEKAERILVLEELEPFVEMQLRSEASRLGWNGTILGKLDQLFPRVGKYSQEIIGRGLSMLVEGGEEGSAAGTGRAAKRGTDGPAGGSLQEALRHVLLPGDCGGRLRRGRAGHLRGGRSALHRPAAGVGARVAVGRGGSVGHRLCGPGHTYVLHGGHAAFVGSRGAGPHGPRGQVRGWVVRHQHLGGGGGLLPGRVRILAGAGHIVDPAAGGRGELGHRACGAVGLPPSGTASRPDR